MKPHQVILLILPLLFSFKSINQKITADKKKSSLSYTMVHPMHEWTGTSKDVNSIIVYNPEADVIESAAVSIMLSTFDSNNSNRDSHALEVLDGIKYPTVKFVSTTIHQIGNQMTIDGKLTFHNVTRPISIIATRQSSKKDISIAGTFVLNITDYSIDAPSLLGIKTKEEITIVYKLVFPTDTN